MSLASRFYQKAPTGGGGISNVVEDTTPQLGGDLDAQGFDINNGGVVFLTEQAVAEVDVAGKGQLWIKDAAPNQPWFTNDAGMDFHLLTHEFEMAVGDEETVVTTGQKFATDMPYGMVLTRVYASIVAAGTTSAITMDVEDEGTSLLNAVLSLSAGANNAETSAFAAAATSYTLSKGDRLTVDIDAVDSGGTGAGLKIFLIGYRTDL